jgi:hypothetical protein
MLLHTGVPPEEQDIRRKLEPYTVCVVREEGRCALHKHVIWKIADEQEWPCLLYWTRYRFDFDPLAEFIGKRKGMPY